MPNGNIKDLLERPSGVGRPRLVVPVTMQWKLADAVDRREDADRILRAPEFVTAVKLSVIRAASPETRARWLASDPEVRDGDYLLELLELAKLGAKLAAVNLLGNRPALSSVILDLELYPLYPAAARHTADIEQHARLAEQLMTAPDSGFAASIFCDRTDVPWPLRGRVLALQRSARGRLDEATLQRINRPWDAVVFSEAGDSSVHVETIGSTVAATRRGASAVLTSDTQPGASLLDPARRVARISITSEYIANLSRTCHRPEPVPREVIEAIAATPLWSGVVGPTVGRPGMRPSPTPNALVPARRPQRPTAAPDPHTRPDPVDRERPMIVRHWWG